MQDVDFLKNMKIKGEWLEENQQKDGKGKDRVMGSEYNQRSLYAHMKMS
jgi:hypothetical protein